MPIDIEKIIDIIGSLLGVLTKIFDAIVMRFLELVIDYMTGNIVDNVYMFSFFLIILSTTVILYLKFVTN